LWVWAVGLFVAFLTAFYMFRLMGLTFWGAFRGPKEIWDRIHESPGVMTIPLILLAIPSVVLGIALGLPFGDGVLHHWLEPVFHHATDELLALPHEPYALFGIDGALILASVTVAAVGVAVAWRLFGADLGAVHLPARPERVRDLSSLPGLAFLYRASLNKWWFDDLYHVLFIVIGGRIASALWWFDREVVDGTVNDIGRVTVAAGRGLRRVQTGRVQNYALGIAIGLIVMAGSYLILAGGPR
jgi:NADH-quinone oxidoreductase subunit L